MDKMARVREARGEAVERLRKTPQGDFPWNKRSRGRLKLCRWDCGKTTRNVSEVCDTCWKESDARIYGA